MKQHLFILTTIQFTWTFSLQPTLKQYKIKFLTNKNMDSEQLQESNAED
jgi:hypothetical protein